MAKKLIALALLFALAVSAALAQPDDELFDTGKKALALLSYGEYGSALSLMGMEAPEAEFSAQIEKDFRALFQGTVQTEVAVMFREDRDWYLAIPVTEPRDDRVETMVFSLGNGTGFQGVECASWGDVTARVDKCDECQWDKEYSKAAPVLMPDL